MQIFAWKLTLVKSHENNSAGDVLLGKMTIHCIVHQSLTLDSADLLQAPHTFPFPVHYRILTYTP